MNARANRVDHRTYVSDSQRIFACRKNLLQPPRHVRRAIEAVHVEVDDVNRDLLKQGPHLLWALAGEGAEKCRGFELVENARGDAAAQVYAADGEQLKRQVARFGAVELDAKIHSGNRGSV